MASQRSNEALWRHFNRVLTNEAEPHLGQARPEAVRQELNVHRTWGTRQHDYDPDYLPDQTGGSPLGSDVDEEEEEQGPSSSFRVNDVPFTVKRTYFKSNENFR